MEKKIRLLFVFLLLLVQAVALAQVQNPIIFADVPDVSMIRVGNNYYMSSTTMHMSPGVPIMKSTDLVNWKIINYAYDILADIPELNLTDGKNAYSKGSWASSLRFHNGMYYVTTFSYTTGLTYIFKTPDIDKGNWQRVSFAPAYHDNSLFFDDDGKVYLIYGSNQINMIELNTDLTGIKKNTPQRVLIANASEPVGPNPSLPAEGSQLFKINGTYYLFNVCAAANWGMRTVIIHRATNIIGPWEGIIGFQDKGIAQGGLIDTPDGHWFSYLFQDHGSVGRVPCLVPVNWENGWPVLGVNGKAPDTLDDLPASTGLILNLVSSDEFDREDGQAALPVVWQWNHNPDNTLWSVQERKGYLRLKTARIDTVFTQVRNILTQRTIGPVCTGSTLLDVSAMKDGDFAGLTAFQNKFGQVGVKVENGQKSIVMVSAGSGKPVEVQKIPLTQNNVYLKIDCDFTNQKDEAKFSYSLDGIVWNSIGNILKMIYDIPHFMGYRFGLFNYATKNTGGYADFDFFHITDNSILLSNDLIHSNQVSISPNPATDKISLFNCNNGLIKIYDLQGKLSLSTEIKSSIDISILKSGVYIVQINDLKSITYVKLIKK
jgi:beta-xylosidase